MFLGTALYHWKHLFCNFPYYSNTLTITAKMKPYNLNSKRDTKNQLTKTDIEQWKNVPQPHHPRQPYGRGPRPPQNLQGKKLCVLCKAKRATQSLDS